jgi:hypothetical protein
MIYATLQCQITDSDEEEYHITGECRMNPDSCIYNTLLYALYKVKVP